MGKGSYFCQNCNRNECKKCCSRCIERCTRACLIIPNLLFLLCGFTLVGVGIWMRADHGSPFYIDILRNIPAGPLLVLDKFPVVFIVVGSCIAVLSFLGCCGACAESICFLCLYTFALFLIIFAEVILGIVIAILQHQILNTLTNTMQQQMIHEYNKTARYTNDTKSLVYHLTVAWDSMQITLNCCGATGPKDYLESAWYNASRIRDPTRYVPLTCCSFYTDLTYEADAHNVGFDCQQEAHAIFDYQGNEFKRKESITLKTQGCTKSISDLIRSNLSIVMGIVCGTIFLQIVDLSLGCILMKWVRRKQIEYPIYEDEDYEQE